MAVVITNIGSLVTNDQSLGLGLLGEINNAAVVIDDGKVAWLGSASDAPAADQSFRLYFVGLA